MVVIDECMSSGLLVALRFEKGLGVDENYITFFLVNWGMPREL